MRRHILSAFLATFTALAVCGCSGFLRDEQGQPTTLGNIIDAGVSGAAAGAGAGGPVGAGVGGVAGLLLGLLVALRKDKELQALKKKTGAIPAKKAKCEIAPELSGDSGPHDVAISTR